MRILSKNPLLFIICAFVFTSCYYNKRLVYLQDNTFSETQPKLVENRKSTYQLQPNDILSIKVKSSTDAQVSDIFNITTTTQAPMFTSPGNLYLEGYSIDEEGKITLPIIGALTVKGMSVEQAQDLIQLNANKYLKNATVIVKLISFKVTVLGEVNNPGYHYVYNNQITILEALGLAGDLTPVGSRKNIKLVRQVQGGSEVVLLDLTNPNLLKSKYFYLMPNDALYVEPLKARSRRLNLEHLTLVFSAATTAILILNYLDNNN
ncbi:polysaccharide biosynthesis/export family protein [Chryseolinea sp. H1M3-3]|uniref:polysaccharide biosynthesis/export family protein n=1 Tax=Chryseolinea sp. H1M3-3 TaxID=3034144 RepID=UPI0023EBD99D|nr:polysaccharide biosynthesis/export family protein [Chryseolinea sp. H1M3-3]